MEGIQRARQPGYAQGSKFYVMKSGNPILNLQTGSDFSNISNPGYAFIADHILLEHIISTHEEGFQTLIFEEINLLIRFGVYQALPSTSANQRREFMEILLRDWLQRSI